MNIGMILAGGVSRRMNRVGSTPKQYLEVGGKPIIAHTIEHFQQEPAVDHVLVAAQSEYFELLEVIKIKYGLTKIKWLVESGEHRHDTVYNALKFLTDICRDEDVIVNVSAVAPILSRHAIRASIAAAAESGAATAVVPLRNTPILIGPDCEIDDVPDRSKFRIITEPHAYRYGIIKKAYDKAYAEGLIDETVTDDAQILHLSGIRQVLIDGNTDFIKITYQNDIRVFEHYLEDKDGLSGGMI